MTRTKFLTLFILPFSISVFSQNPIVPPGVYVADPSAKVWGSGKLYVYGSRDERPDYYCSKSYHVLSTKDMKNWNIHEYTFSSAGKNDEVPYNDANLFAPDCQKANNKYYLYYSQPSKGEEGGVAVGNSQVGPFKNGKKMNLGHRSQIDPNVFIDDDGQAYYIWGQFSLKIARLKPNMTEIDTSSVVKDLITEKEHHFHEGANMRKRNGIYYLVYSHMGRGNTPTCIGYATSDSPLGPFTYGGVIIDNIHSDPGAWNNHGSIEKFNDQWYIFYHRPTHGSVAMRKACVEPISFNEDGSIDEVEMTSQGAGPPLNAMDKIDAARACILGGNVRIEGRGENREVLAKTENQNRAGFKYLDFDNGVKKVSANVKVPENCQGGRIQFLIDQSWTTPVGYIDVPSDKKEEWITLTGDIDSNRTKGVHSLWLRFNGTKDAHLFEVDSFTFY